jgi:rhodanese-related sulfurtransferase
MTDFHATPDRRVNLNATGHLWMLWWLFAGLIFLTSCTQTIKVSDKDLTSIDYKHLNTLMSSSKPQDVVIVDVRKAEDFNQGHIPGAINIFLPDLVAGDARLGKASHIIVYANSFADPLSRAAGKRLLALGYKGVEEFQGGVESWRAQGKMLAVIREPTSGDSK